MRCTEHLPTVRDHHGRSCLLAHIAFAFPPVFGLATFVCGVVALVKGNVGRGIGIIFMAVICTVVGMNLGAMMMSHL